MTQESNKRTGTCRISSARMHVPDVTKLDARLHNGKRTNLLKWPIFRLTKLVFFRARALLEIKNCNGSWNLNIENYIRGK